MHVIVFGAGVIGLTTALVLHRRQYQVSIYAKQKSPHTVSDVAAAFWYPYAAQPLERVQGWAAHSFAEFARLAQEAPQSGVRKRRLIRYYQGDFEPPGFASVTEDYSEETVTAEGAPAGVTHAVSFNTFVIDMGKYMPFLMRECELSGISMYEIDIAGWQPQSKSADKPPLAPVYVNCTGLGARELVPDPTLVGVKGQVVRVRARGAQPPQMVLLDETNHTRFRMVVPRENEIVLGGTFEESFAAEGVENEEVERILNDCRAMCPQLTDIEVVGSASGLRPCRPSVCLELERLSDSETIVHNYGHGGAGVTLSWGCAEEVAQLVENVSRQKNKQSSDRI